MAKRLQGNPGNKNDFTTHRLYINANDVNYLTCILAIGLSTSLFSAATPAEESEQCESRFDARSKSILELVFPPFLHEVNFSVILVRSRVRREVNSMSSPKLVQLINLEDLCEYLQY